MLPKRPVSCLALIAVPTGLLLILLAIGVYGLKFFYRDTPASSQSASVSTATTTAAVAESPASAPEVSLLPASAPSTTRILVATASADAAKEAVYSVSSAGVVTADQTPNEFAPATWKTQGISLTPPVESVTGSAWRVTGKNWNVPLRTRSGSIWQDPVILGLFSSGRLAVVAYRTQRALLSVGRSGDIQVVEVLDDALSPLTVQGSSAWFVRAPQAEGVPIEALPQGPSELVRISESGTSSTVAQDPALILELVPSPALATLAYLSSDASLVLVNGNQLHSSIVGWRPLAWLDATTLFVSRGKTLGWIDLHDPGKVIFFAEVPNLIRGVWVAPTSATSVVK